MVLLSDDPEKVVLLSDGDLSHRLFQAGGIRSGRRGLDQVAVELGPLEAASPFPSKVEWQDLQRDASFGQVNALPNRVTFESAGIFLLPSVS